MRVKFACSYPAEPEPLADGVDLVKVERPGGEVVEVPRGGCPHQDSWKAEGAKVQVYDLAKMRPMVDEDDNPVFVVEVSEADAACPDCGRTGVAESDLGIRIIA